jgi:Family of unknown function (DUF6062)
MTLPARDLVDVRLSAALAEGGCPLCVVRARSENAMLEGIISEFVLDIPFRRDLERTQGFCRRHTRALIETDRRGSGILGSSMLYSAVLSRRLELVRDLVGTKGRTLRSRVSRARARPPCVACAQGESAVDIAAHRLLERSTDPAWAEATADAAFCLDDLLLLWSLVRDEPAWAPIARRQLERLEDIRIRLDGFADHSAHDRRELLTDAERAAADDAAALLGGAEE